jgi:hypothetical protein
LNIRTTMRILVGRREREFADTSAWRFKNSERREREWGLERAAFGIDLTMITLAVSTQGANHGDAIGSTGFTGWGWLAPSGSRLNWSRCARTSSGTGPKTFPAAVQAFQFLRFPRCAYGWQSVRCEGSDAASSLSRGFVQGDTVISSTVHVRLRSGRECRDHGRLADAREARKCFSEQMPPAPAHFKVDRWDLKQPRAEFPVSDPIAAGAEAGPIPPTLP